MPKMVNNSVVNAPFYQEKRKIGGRSGGTSTDMADPDPSSVTVSENNEHLRKIFVGGLSINTTADTMRKFFSHFGAVSDAVVMRDPISNRSRGFGFVTYVEPEAVENVQRARPHIIDSKTVDTKRAFPRHEFKKAIGNLSNVKTNKIFLGGLKDCHDESTLREYFAQFGTISSVKVLLDKETGRKRGFGFLEFDDTASAARALAQSKHSIKLVTVEVKKSTQMDCSKRIRLPIGGAACAGYAPPQPTIMDNLVYNPNYNPYQAQTSLPPSAFFNGWASYVAPTIPTTMMSYHQRQLSGYPQGGWSYGNPSYIGSEWTRNSYSSTVGQPKSEQKSNFTQPLQTERPKNEYKSVQAEEATKKQASVAVGDDKLENHVTIDVEKKWLAKEYKVFKPTGRYNFGTPQVNHISSLTNDISTPAYGI